MTSTRLSALDSSFLAVETPTAHMHVGWVALFSVPEDRRPPSFPELRSHVAARLGRAPRYRQMLAPVPLGLHSPEWIDDPDFSVERHVYWAPGPVEELVDEVMSMPLRRDRPLWEMWVCEDAEAQQLAIVGKAHHCMVDGIAAVELGSLLLDPTPEPAVSQGEPWRAEPRPGAGRLLLRGVRDLAGQQLGVLRWSLRGLASPVRAAEQAAGNAMRLGRALSHSFLSAAPESVLNRALTPLRSLSWAQRPLGELQAVKRTYGTTVNDVMLAAVAGAMRAYLMRHGERPVPLKAMVPVSVRAPEDVLGNRISFVFVELPCDEPDPLGRLYKVHSAMSKRKHDGEPEGADMALKAAAFTPGIVQQAISKLVASPRTFNLVVSNIPGPAQTLYMLGCPLKAAYPVVPLSDEHAVSVGMTTVDGRACFGVYADRGSMPDPDALAQDVDAAVGELLAEAARTSASLSPASSA